MRRILAASALTAALFGAAACSSTGTDNADAGSSPSAAAPSPTVSLVDKKTSCANFEAATTAAGLKLLGAMGEAFKTVSETDPAKVEEAMKTVLADLKTGIGEMRTAAEKEAAAAADAELKAQLVIAAAELAKIEADLGKVSTVTDAENLPEMETPELDAATTKIEELCK